MNISISHLSLGKCDIRQQRKHRFEACDCFLGVDPGSNGPGMYDDNEHKGSVELANTFFWMFYILKKKEYFLIEYPCLDYLTLTLVIFISMINTKYIQCIITGPYSKEIFLNQANLQ